MYGKTTWKLMALVCLAAGAIWMMRRSRQADEKTGIRLGARLPLPRGEEVQELTIESDAYSVHCVRDQGRWRMTRPAKAEADGGRIEQILSALESLIPADLVLPEQMALRQTTPQHYGLEPPQVRFTLFDGLRTFRLDVGHGAPLSDLLYARLDRHEAILAVDPALLQVTPADIAFLRDRSLFPANVLRARRLEIQRPRGGFIRIEKTDNLWMIREPIAARANPNTVTALLETLRQARIQDFVWDRPVELSAATDPADHDLMAYGLTVEDAALGLTLWIDGEEIPRSLTLGRALPDDKTRRYARRQDAQSVFAVEAALLTALSIEDVNLLRDPSLFGLAASEVERISLAQDKRRITLEREARSGWMIVEPVQWKADEIVAGNLVQRFADLTILRYADGSRTNLTELGLDPPAYQVSLATARTDPSARRWLQVGRTQADDRAAVRFANDPPVFGEGATVAYVAAPPLRFPIADLVNPLTLRDRTMLSLLPEQVRSIALTRGEATHRLARSPAGIWEVVGDEPRPITEKNLEQIFFHAAHLRALSIVAHNPTNLAPYGLAPPKVALTFGLTGEAGIQTSLLLGREAGPESVFAMIQGQDIVFTLESGTARALTSVPTGPAKEKEP